MGGFPEYSLDGSKFDSKSFQQIDRETRHAATAICSTIRLDSFQPAYDANGKRIASEDPDPFIVDVPRIPKGKDTEVSGSGTLAIAAPNCPEDDNEELPFNTPVSAICWETKPIGVSLKKKGTKVVQIQEPGKEQGSPSKRTEAASTPSTTTDPATAPGPN